jgi:hypothetical protein
MKQTPMKQGSTVTQIFPLLAARRHGIWTESGVKTTKGSTARDRDVQQGIANVARLISIRTASYEAAIPRHLQKGGVD